MVPTFQRPGQQRNQYFDLLEGLPLIVYSVEPFPPYLPLYVSPEIDVLGYSRSEWLDVPDRWVRSLDDRDRKRVLEATERAMSAGQMLDIEYRLRARDGSVRWFHDRGNFVYDPDGAPVEFRGVLLDITDRKNAQLQLVENRAQLSRVQNQLDLAQQPAPRGNRAEGIVHRLNDLLQIISANASLLADAVARRPDALAHVAEIRDAVERAVDIAEELAPRPPERQDDL